MKSNTQFYTVSVRTLVIPFYYGSSSDFLACYGSGSGSATQKVTVPVSVPQRWYHAGCFWPTWQNNLAGNWQHRLGEGVVLVSAVRRPADGQHPSYAAAPPLPRLCANPGCRPARPSGDKSQVISLRCVAGQHSFKTKLMTFSGIAVKMFFSARRMGALCLSQCCGSGSGIRLLFDPLTRIRDP
jgi:hypothetical protein